MFNSFARAYKGQEIDEVKPFQAGVQNVDKGEDMKEETKEGQIK